MEFQLKFTTSCIQEIKQEIKELKDDADSDDDDVIDKVYNLKKELKIFKESQKEIHHKWKETSEAEVKRRTELQSSSNYDIEKFSSSDTMATSSTSLKRKHSDLEKSTDCDVPKVIGSDNDESSKPSTLCVTHD